MSKYVELVDAFLNAYNAKDFARMGAMLTDDVDMAHYNRGAAFSSKEDLLAILPAFADVLVPDRAFSPALRVTASGRIVVRESDFGGTATQDVPGFAEKGPFTLRLCSVFRFDDNDLIAEWKDHG
jgi:hypothetical protein